MLTAMKQKREKQILTDLANEQVVLSRWMMVDGLRRRDEHPDDVDEDLDEHEPGADDQLRFGRDEVRSFGRSLGCVEDPSDAVGFGQERSVHNAVE